MLKDSYYNIENRKEIIISLRFWMMWDLHNHGQTKETEQMLKNLEKIYSKTHCKKFFEEAWNGLTATFLNQFGIEPLIIYH